MAIKAWLADKEFDPPPELLRNLINRGAHRLQGRAIACNGGLRDTRRRAVFAEDFAQRAAPLAGRDAGAGRRDRGFHDVAAFFCRPFDFAECCLGLFVIAPGAPGFELTDLFGFHRRIDDHDGVEAARQRRWFRFEIAVDADDDEFAAFDLAQTAGPAFDQAALHVIDGGDSSAHFFDGCEFGSGFFLQRCDLLGDLGRAFEDIGVFEQIGFIGEDLLHPQRPLLIPGPGKPERLVPGRQLDGAGASVLRQRDSQHFEQNAIDVVFSLRLGQTQRVDLHAVPEQPVLGVCHAVALARDLVPHFGECAHLAHFGDEAHSGVDEKRHAADDVAEFSFWHLAGRLDRIEHGDAGRQRESELLHRCRAGFLQMIGADVGRVPLRNVLGREHDGVLDQPQRWLWRENIGTARQIFLDDVVLDRAG